MPAPVLQCPSCSFQIVYNSDFTPTRCPKCKQTLGKASNVSLPHLREDPTFYNGLPHEVLRSSDPQGTYKKVKSNPITDSEIEERRSKGTIDEIQ